MTETIRKSKESTHVSLAINLKAEVFNRLDTFCREFGLTKTEFIEKAIIDYLERNGDGVKELSAEAVRLIDFLRVEGYSELQIAELLFE